MKGQLTCLEEILKFFHVSVRMIMHQKDVTKMKNDRHTLVLQWWQSAVYFTTADDGSLCHTHSVAFGLATHAFSPVNVTGSSLCWQLKTVKVTLNEHMLLLLLPSLPPSL